MNLQGIKLYFTLLLLIVLLSFKAFAQVNMRNGSYTYKMENAHLALEYNSRSLFYGKFGFGWCSLLDPELQMEKESITFQKCDSFTIYRLKDKAAKTTTYIAEDGSLLTSKDNKFTLRKKDLLFVFNSSGKLLECEDAKNKYSLTYLNQEVVEFKSLDGIVRVEWDEGLITGLYSNKSAQSFIFKNNNLVSWIKDTKTQNSFQYDELNNLNEVTASGGVLETLQYDKINDLVLELKNKKGCLEKYDYQNLDEGIFQAQGKISCSSGTFAETRHTFYFEPNKAGNVTLARVVSVINGTSFEKNYLSRNAFKGETNERVNRKFSSSL